MVRLPGNVKSVSMLSLPLQLLRTAAAAGPGGSAVPQIQQRALAALWFGNDAGDRDSARTTAAAFIGVLGTPR
jgi:hypothetical protein